tara:strand:- start:11784 stop:12335 length:552 start_codon:yes stop_codon:yes gene_type:complete
MNKPLIPFGWMPGHWGLRGMTREMAQAEYELQGTNLEKRLLEIRLKDNPTLMKRGQLDLQRKHQEISKYDYDIARAELDFQGSELVIKKLDIDLEHGKITNQGFERKKADALGQPWVSMPTISWVPENASRTYFELDYNEHFIKYLQDHGYTGTEDEILNRWLYDVCTAVAGESSEQDFVRNS